MQHTVNVHIHLNPEGGWPPVAAEEVEALPLEEHRFRLISPPAFAKRLAVGDVVRVVHYGSPEVPWVEEIIESGGHSTIRVIFFRSKGDSPEADLRSKMKRFGVQVFETPFQGLVAIDVPQDVSYKAIRDYLSAGEDRKLWEFEEGAISLAHDTGPR